jgi:hypothetical protein
MNRTSRQVALGLVVLTHLAVTMVHGAAHSAADVPLGAMGMAFVVVVIMAAPLAGLAWMRFNAAAGARLLGLSMGAALVFGAVNHFMIPGADHVAHLAGPWRQTFGVTAVLLVVTEAVGAWLGLAVSRRGASPLDRFA